MLDGVDRTSLFTKSATEATAQLGSGTALSDGLHTLQAQIKHKAVARAPSRTQVAFVSYRFTAP